MKTIKYLVLLLLAITVGCTDAKPTMSLTVKEVTTEYKDFNEYTKATANALHETLLRLATSNARIEVTDTDLKNIKKLATEGLTIADQALKFTNGMTPTKEEQDKYNQFKMMLEQSKICFTDYSAFADTKDESKRKTAFTAYTKASPFISDFRK